MKPHVSLVVLLSMVVSLSQPVWSMEEDATEKRATSFKKVEEEEREKEGEPKSAEFMDGSLFNNLPEEARLKIFFEVLGEDNQENLKSYLNCQLVSHSFYRLWNDPTLIREILRKSEKNYVLEKEKELNGDEASKVRSLFRRLNMSRQLQSQDQINVLLDALENGPASQSRLLAYETVLLLGNNLEMYLPGNSPKQLIADKMRTVFSSLLEDCRENRAKSLPTDPATDEALLYLYLLQNLYAEKYPQIFKNRVESPELSMLIEDAKNAVKNKDKKRQGEIPAYVFRHIALNTLSLPQNWRAALLGAAILKGDISSRYSLADACEHGFCGVITPGVSYVPLPIDLNKSAALLSELAKRGIIKAQLRLAHLYRYGGQIPSNPPFILDLTKAIDWYTQASEKGSPDAAFYLGQVYEQGGENVPQDISKAIDFYTLSANRGDDDAVCKLSQIYQEGGISPDPEKSLDFLKRAAKMGHSSAQIDLARRYKRGDGVAQNHKKAFKLFKKAAKEDEEALYEIGLCYESGEGVPQNISMAIANFDMCIDESEEGAHQGASEKLFHYSLHYQSLGYFETSFQSLKSAARGGHPEALYIAAVRFLYDPSFSHKRKKGEIWLSRAKMRGHKGAALLLESLKNPQSKCSQIPALIAITENP